MMFLTLIILGQPSALRLKSGVPGKGSKLWSSSEFSLCSWLFSLAKKYGKRRFSQKTADSEKKRGGGGGKLRGGENIP